MSLDQGGLKSSPPQSPRLSVVVPTFNERDNIDAMVECLERALAGQAWEVIFVDDDSTDGTAAHVRTVAQGKPHVRCIQRLGRRGLSSAVIEGILSSSAPFVAVIDGDLQHDERLLPAMMKALEGGEFDVVVGSRYAEGGGVGAWDPRRAAMSRFATRVSRLVVPATLSDPMSGFFMLRRPAFESAMRRLSGTGYKILLDLFSSVPRPLRYREFPYQFRERRAGASKVESAVLWEHLLLLLDKMLGGQIPARFISFAIVGSVGLVVHFTTLVTLLKVIGASFPLSQAAGTVVAMTSNFLMNNALTYSDHRLASFGLLRGLFSFYMICAVGAVANVGVANFVFERQHAWWVAGVAGVLVGTVWNYTMTALFTWNERRPPR